MRTDTEIDLRIKLYEEQFYSLFEKEIAKKESEFCSEFKAEEHLLNQKIMLLQWVKGVDIYRDDSF